MVYFNGGKGPCGVNGITYNVTCMKCTNSKEKYYIFIGETSSNACKRSKEHLSSLARKAESSVLWRHSNDKHNESITQFCMSVTGQFKNDAIL